MKEAKTKGMLLGAIIGDALGTPLDGLSKGHILSTLKNIESYTDTGPALKGKLSEWKKSGLYSAASQLMMLLSIFMNQNKKPNISDFIKFIDETPVTDVSGYGIFRHPSPMLRHFIRAVKSGKIFSKDDKYINTGTDTSPILVPLALYNTGNPETRLLNTLSFALVFTRDTHAASGTIIFNALLWNLLKTDELLSQKNIFINVLETAGSISEKLETLSAEIFSLGINPDSLLSSVKDYINILSGIADISDINKAETKIIDYLNARIKTPVTRATVNHPLAIIPFSIYCAGFYSTRPQDTLFRTAEYGGSSSVLCSLTGALCGAASGFDCIPDNLLDELVNKKRVINLVDSVSKGKASNDILPDFIQSEASLTAKEIQEKDSRLKHVKIKKKKQKSRLEIERQMSNHVVESWTKLDKAKWKKKSHKDYLYNSE